MNAHCDTCAQPLATHDCPSPVCNGEDRAFGRLWAIHPAADDSVRAITKAVKAGDVRAALKVGSELARYLHANPALTKQHDLLIANPTHRNTFPNPTGKAPLGHTEAVLVFALLHHPGIHAAPNALTKTRPTPSSCQPRNRFETRIQTAALHANAIEITEPELIEGANILLFDDIATTLTQIDAVASLLVINGAASVNAIVYGRSVYTPRT